MDDVWTEWVYTKIEQKGRGTSYAFFCQYRHKTLESAQQALSIGYGAIWQGVYSLDGRIEYLVEVYAQ